MNGLSPIRSAAVSAVLLCTAFAGAQVPSPLTRGDELVVSVVGDAKSFPHAADTSEVEFGSVSFYSTDHQRKRNANSYVTLRHIRLRVERKDGARGKSTLRAFLIHECDRCTVRLDGVVLTSTPVPVGRILLLNTVTDHILEIEVKRFAPSGDLGAEIGWQIEEL
jgi:hypothetical protein